MTRLPLSLLLACLFLGPAFPIRAIAQDASLAIPATDDGLPGAGPIRRAENFQKTWNGRRAAFAKSAADDKNGLVFLGDSITQGAAKYFATSFPGVKVVNRGISGDTTRGMLIRLQKDVLDLDPIGVVLLMGTNDLAEKADAATIAGNVKLIIAALEQKNPKLPIVLCTVFPSSAKALRPTDKIKEINSALLEAVRGDSRVTVVDTWSMFANADGDAKMEEFPDLLHPNDGGRAKWVAAIRPVLETLSLVPAEPDSFQPEEGFVSLFNGKDLSGWGVKATPEDQVKARENNLKKNPNLAWPVFEKDKAFDGKTTSDDGRYVAKNGRLVVVTPAEGRRVQTLWTTREFPNDFTLRLEFRATPNADSGVFLRKPQLQCRDYTVAGPYKMLKDYKPQEWNVLEVVATGGTARCTCNGEVLEEAYKLPATGPIGLEGDRGQMEYRRIRIKTTN